MLLAPGLITDFTHPRVNGPKQKAILASSFKSTDPECTVTEYNFEETTTS